LGVAVVVAKPGAQLEPGAIIKHLKAIRRILNFEAMLLVEELPEKCHGKVQKNLLRESIPLMRCAATGRSLVKPCEPFTCLLAPCRVSNVVFEEAL